MINLNNRTMCENCFSPISTEPCPYCGYSKKDENTTLNLLAPGTVLLGKYIVGKTIGVGGFGITYLGYDAINGRKIAIKEYFPQSLVFRGSDSQTVNISSVDNEEALNNGKERFYDEAKLVSRFNGNPNIVSVHEFFYENNTAYFVMEYLKGMDLKHYISNQGGKISEGEMLTILNEVTSALMVAHSANVLHRDISPDNIFLCEDGSVKLIDFGAARQYSNEQSKSMSVILKQGFAPLEQYQKRGKQGPWTDIYALGATAYYALTGKLLEDPISRLESDAFPDYEELGIEKNLYAIIMKCIQLQIPERYANVFELKSDLNSLKITPLPLDIQKSEEVEPLGVAASESVITVGAPIQNSNVSNIDITAPIVTGAIQSPVTEPERQKLPVKKLAIAASAAVVVIGGVIAMAIGGGRNQPSQDWDITPTMSAGKFDADDVTETPGPTKNPDLTEKPTPTKAPAPTEGASVVELEDIAYEYYDAGKYEEARESFLKAAVEGSADAMNMLGCMYLEGLGCVANQSKAYGWFKQAYEAGNVDGTYNYGYCYYNGVYVEVDYAEALRLFKKAADGGEVYAYSMLGECYYYGYGAKQNYSTAFRWLDKAHAKECYEKSHLLGDCYLFGYGTSLDYELAIEAYEAYLTWYDDETGVVTGTIGYAYEQLGYKTKAFQHYQKAAELGDIISISNLGGCYYHGIGTDVDKTKAFEYLKKAYENECYDNSPLLGDYYISVLDYELAIEVYETYLTYSDKENGAVECNRGYAYEQLGDKKKAFQCYQKSAKAGDEVGTSNLGGCYYWGIGTDVDKSKAKKYWEKAVELGYTKAQEYLDEYF